MKTRVRCATFSTMTLPKLMTIPPQPPPIDLFGFSECCFRATCIISSKTLTDQVRVVGYNRSPRIANDTERACKVIADHNTSWKCSSASLVMLPSSDDPCTGQMYFHIGPKTKRLV